jgi:hypothetical protein
VGRGLRQRRPGRPGTAAAEVLAADQRVTAWAKELRKAGVEGGMDALRARAYLDILLGIDSRPPGTSPDGTSEPKAPAPAPGGPLAGMIPRGFAGRVTMTITAPTLLGLAGRSGEMDGIGPIDPDLARDLAAAAARNCRSTWCVTVTDSQGHAIGHGCARPAPASTAGRHKPDTSGGPDPPGGPRFTFTRTDKPGPPGGYGTWRFSTGIPGQRDLLIAVGPLPTGECDHRHEARAMIPGSCCGTWPRCGTPRVPGRGAGGQPRTATLSITFRMMPVAVRVCATGIPSAAVTTGSSRTHAGTPRSFRADTYGGLCPPDGSTSPNPPATPSRSLIGV